MAMRIHGNALLEGLRVKGSEGPVTVATVLQFKILSSEDEESSRYLIA